MCDTIVSINGDSIHYKEIVKNNDHKEWNDNELAEFKKAYTPLVEYLHKNWHMHTWIIVEWDRVSIATDEIGSPIQVPD